MEPKQGTLMRIYVGETNRHHHRPLFEWLLSQADEFGIAGATVVRGMQGFGEHHHMHSTKILRLAQDLPIVIEMADESERIQQFLQKIESSLAGAVVTTQKIQIRRYPDAR